MESTIINQSAATITAITSQQQQQQSSATASHVQTNNASASRSHSNNSGPKQGKPWRNGRNRKSSSTNDHELLSQSSSSTLSGGSQATVTADTANDHQSASSSRVNKKKSQSNARSSKSTHGNAGHRSSTSHHGSGANVSSKAVGGQYNKHNSYDSGYQDQTIYNTKLGSKKTNLNHLLNFTYESLRESNDNYYEYERLTKQFWSMKLSKNSYFSKEQFLQANCQFVVKSNADYSIHMADPDLLVDWDKIEEIHIGSTESMTCPICLYPPQAGKMTKCGHVYCWSCILHYLALSDKTWRKCPICFESIYKNDLKSLRVIDQAREFKIGDEIDFNLMFKHKHKHNAIILPMSVHDQFLSDEKSLHNSTVTFNLFNKPVYSDCHKYIKLHPKSDQQIYDEVIRRERDELNKQIENEKHQPEVCFANEALEMLAEREKNLKLNSNRVHKEKKEATKVEEKLTNKKEDEQIQLIKPDKTYADAFDDKLSESTKPDDVAKEEPLCEKEPIEDAHQEEIVSSKAEAEEKTETDQQQQQQPANNDNTGGNVTNSISGNNNNNNSNNSEFSYFYQSTDGQRIYINALNTRCLITEYSSFAQCPLVISGKIVACDSYFMSEENRKRYKYLSHLPLHSEFKVVELDLKEPTISKRTLEQFKDEIEERKQMRARKEIREKRMADKIAASQAVEPSYYVQSAAEEIKYMRNSSDGGGTFGDIYSNEFPEASTSPTFSSGISISGNSNTSVSDSTSSSANVNSASAVSFAQALKHRNNLAYNNNKSAWNNNNAKKLNDLDLWPSLDTNSPANANLNNNNSNSNAGSSNSSSSASNQSSNPLLGLNQANSTQITSGWLTMVKHQEQTTLGRTRKYQEAPTAWGLSNKNNTLISSMVEQNSDDECMPAPQYKESFFSAIDASLKHFESKEKSNTVFDALDETQEAHKDHQTTSSAAATATTQASKKKKKTKQLLFSTTLNMGI